VSDDASVNDAVWAERGARSLAASWEALVGAIGGRLAHAEDVWLADAASPNSMLNAATLTRPLRRRDTETFTRRLEAFFGTDRPGGPWVLWSAWPTPDLSALGYMSWGSEPIMLRRPGGEPPPAPPDLRIAEARDADELAEMERVFVRAFPMRRIESKLPGAMFHPRLLGGPFRVWGGYVNEELVTVVGAHVGDEIIDVSFVATQPHARRRGYGAAVTWQASLADPALPAILQATRDGRPVYERMGFREVGRMTMWEYPRDPANPVYSWYPQPQS
jgi:GNAT superfamily N-acetyltransferase